MNNKIKSILICVLLVAIGVIGYLVYNEYQIYSANDESNVSKDKEFEGNLEDAEINNEVVEEDTELIREIKNKISSAHSSDSYEGFIEAYKLSQGVNTEDEEYNILLTFAKMRITTWNAAKESVGESFTPLLSSGDKREIQDVASLVHPDYYNGMMADTIIEIVYRHMSREEWMEIYNKANGIYMGEPIIGMTKQDIIDKTTWGRPTKINKTENINGVSEQWVYPNHQYLYIEDGILTSISTSN